MKKTLVILGALTLAACTTGYEPNMDKATAKRAANIDARHQVSGCTFTRDHEAYKNCLMNTYSLNSPATYTTKTMQDGRSVAVINSQQLAAANTACGLKPIPAPAEYEWAAPTTVSQTNTVETVCQKKFEPQQTVIQTVEETIPPPTPEVIFVQPEPVPPAAPQPVQTWKAPVEVQPTCPCADPNDPCPQCYDK